jgi:hypothetical protein
MVSPPGECDVQPASSTRAVAKRKTNVKVNGLGSMVANLKEILVHSGRTCQIREKLEDRS